MAQPRQSPILGGGSTFTVISARKHQPIKTPGDKLAHDCGKNRHNDETIYLTCGKISSDVGI
jgi:hypothetical protein